MGTDADVAGLMAPQLELLLPHLDERQRRLVLGSEARALGAGGIAVVARASGVPRQTVAAGAAELGAGAEPLGRARRPGGGRRRAEEQRSGAGAGAAGAGGGRHAGRPAVAADLDDEVAAASGRGADRGRAPVRAGYGGAAAARAGVQPAGQRQDRRGQAAPGPGGPVPLYRRAGDGASWPRASR